MNITSTELQAVFAEERPWGSFEQFLSNAVGTVKVITVAPQQRLSLQRHALRDEMWFVLDGPIDVRIDHAEWQARAGEIVWIPRSALHRLGNAGTSAVRVLEIAFGHFDELDIERLDDDYNRVGAPTRR